jgi:NADH-quinone oxidoreductase subunit G
VAITRWADIHPDVPLANPMSLNTVDICPVGALIDKNFLYQARVWFADRKATVCTSCSRDAT